MATSASYTSCFQDGPKLLQRSFYLTLSTLYRVRLKNSHFCEAFSKFINVWVYSIVYLVGKHNSLLHLYIVMQSYCKFVTKVKIIKM